MAVALGTVAAGCGTAVSPGAAGASQEDDVSVPSLLPAVEPAVETSAEQQPATPPAEQAEDAQTAAEQALPATTPPPTTAAATTATAATTAALSTTGATTTAGATAATTSATAASPGTASTATTSTSPSPTTTTTAPPITTTSATTTTTRPPETGAYREPTVVLDNGWIVYGTDYVPPVHPDTRPPSWVRGTDDGRGRPDDVPRRSEGVQAWLDWCGDGWLGCDRLQLPMVWALDYLGANPQCVIQHYEWRASFASRPGVAEGWNDGSLIRDYGWHWCATVVDPIQPDGRLLSHHGLTVAERCRSVLPADVRLEERTSVANRGVFRHWMTCDEWGEWVEQRQRGTNYPDCEGSARLAEEWLEHFHGMPENFWRISC